MQVGSKTGPVRLCVFGLIHRHTQSVADRDFVAEYLFVCSLLMVHISRIAEDIIIYSSSEFGWVMCGDAYS